MSTSVSPWFGINILLLIKEDERQPPLYGDATNKIKVLTDSSSIFVCTLCNQANSQCYYCLCVDCFSRNDIEPSARVGRIKEKKSPTKTVHEMCSHSKQDLKQLSSVYWCKKEYIGKGKWFQRANGCTSCKKMFVNVGGRGEKVNLPSNFQWPTLEEFDKEIAGFYRDYHSTGKDVTQKVYDDFKRSLVKDSDK